MQKTQRKHVWYIKCVCEVVHAELNLSKKKKKNTFLEEYHYSVNSCSQNLWLLQKRPMPQGTSAHYVFSIGLQNVLCIWSSENLPSFTHNLIRLWCQVAI